MDDACRRRLHRYATTRPPAWYVEHPNSDRATGRLLAALRAAPLVNEASLAERWPKLDGCPLTVRELQCLGGRAAGLSVPAIADVLGVSAETVKTTFQRAHRKMGASGVRAVAVALRAGWL